MSRAAILVAAGSGERLGADRPKALVVVAGRPMLEWSQLALAAAGIHEVVVVLPPGVERPGGVSGGATRSESVRCGLRALSGAVDAVVVHDAARPLVEPALFIACLGALGEADAAIAAAPMTDTVKEAGADGRVVATLDRARLWSVQTPQAFRRATLERALAQPDAVLRAATDDASLVEALGADVRIVQAPPSNFKVTTPHDLDVAELLLGRR